MDAFEFLETLPNATLERLYEDPWACQAVFQALPALAQQFVLRLLSCDAPVHQNVLQQWVQPLPSTGATAASNDSTSPRNSNALVTAKMPPQFDYALQKLVGLRVFVEVAKETFQPHPAFQKQLKVSRRSSTRSTLRSILYMSRMRPRSTSRLVVCTK
jgi:transcription initiation factor TFIIH subunit 4